MNSFPEIKRKTVTDRYDKIVELFNGDQVKLLDAAEIAFSNDPTPFIKSPDDIEPQLLNIRNRVNRIFDNYGRNILVKWIEALHNGINSNGGAMGVSEENFIEECYLFIEDNIEVRLIPSGKWVMEWKLSSQDEEEIIGLTIRDISIGNDDIIPDYIIQYVNQAINAYKNKHYLTSLSLISIALEGTLRDMLEEKGYSYVQGVSSVDGYESKKMEIFPATDGFEIKFPDTMPRDHLDFLQEASAIIPNQVKIKRIKKKGKWRLEIRNADYLIDFWSSNNIDSVGQPNITGLGAALRMARNGASFLDNTILPEDTDDLIQQVRNNLIHLSGVALNTMIDNVGMTLRDFSSNQALVFDTLWSVSGAIDQLYIKKANSTL